MTWVLLEYIEGLGIDVFLLLCKGYMRGFLEVYWKSFLIIGVIMNL